jgi:hypothetical protein
MQLRERERERERKLVLKWFGSNDEFHMFDKSTNERVSKNANVRLLMITVVVLWAQQLFFIKEQFFILFL